MKKYYSFFCQLVREEIVPLLEAFNNQLEEEQAGQAAILAACNEDGGEMSCSATLEEAVDIDQENDQNQVGKSYGFRKLVGTKSQIFPMSLFEGSPYSRTHRARCQSQMKALPKCRKKQLQTEREERE